MHPKTARLLQEVREAILESLRWQDIADAIYALERSGYQVFVSVEATLGETGTLPRRRNGMSVASNGFALSPSDELFLRVLHISI
jgi:hypothetical protein